MGSDGLAEIRTNDILDIVLPKIEREEDRQRVQDLIDTFLKKDLRFSQAISHALNDIHNWPNPELRKDHWMLI